MGPGRGDSARWGRVSPHRPRPARAKMTPLPLLAPPPRCSRWSSDSPSSSCCVRRPRFAPRPPEEDLATSPWTRSRCQSLRRTSRGASTTLPTGVRPTQRGRPTYHEVLLRRRRTGLAAGCSPPSCRVRRPLADAVHARHAPTTSRTTPSCRRHPGPSTYLQPVRLDIGGGRYPIDPFGLKDNDPCADEPTCCSRPWTRTSMQTGSSTWARTPTTTASSTPQLLPRGQPRPADLLSWYERETDIARPVRPLREKTTYAVVLTSLRGAPRRRSAPLGVGSPHPPDRGSAPGH